MTDPITLDFPSESICILKMHDDDSKNALSGTFVDSAIEKVKAIHENKALKVVILKGLEDIFCSGAAKEELIKLCDGDMNVKDLVLSEMIMDIPVPVIAAMEGGAVGGGLVLGLCADIVILAERSMYGGGFSDLGFTPGMGFTRLLKGLVGEYVANEMIFAGTLHKGKTFSNRGCVNYILPKAEVFKKATMLAEIIAEKPRVTLEVLKYSLSMDKRKQLLEARVHEDMMHKITFRQPGIKDIINARYVEKSKSK